MMDPSTRYYISNSWYQRSEWGFIELAYMNLALSIVVLIHSWHAHKAKVSSFRTVSDAYAWLVLLSALCQICYNIFPSQFNYVILYDVVEVAFIQSLQEAFDCWLSFSRFELVYPGVSLKIRIFVVGYVVCLICTWLPFFSFLPLFVNVNNQHMTDLQNNLYYYMFMVPKCIFDAYFTGQFLRAVRNLHTAVNMDNRLIVISYKSVVHTLVSWSTNFLFCFDETAVVSNSVYSALNLIVIHFLFNCPIEAHYPWLFGLASYHAASSSDSPPITDDTYGMVEMNAVEQMTVTEDERHRAPNDEGDLEVGLVTDVDDRDSTGPKGDAPPDPGLTSPPSKATDPEEIITFIATSRVLPSSQTHKSTITPSPASSTHANIKTFSLVYEPDGVSGEERLWPWETVAANTSAMTRGLIPFHGMVFREEDTLSSLTRRGSFHSIESSMVGAEEPFRDVDTSSMRTEGRDEEHSEASPGGYRFECDNEDDNNAHEGVEKAEDARFSLEVGPGARFSAVRRIRIQMSIADGSVSEAGGAAAGAGVDEKYRLRGGVQHAKGGGRDAAIQSVRRDRRGRGRAAGFVLRFATIENIRQRNSESLENEN